MVSGCHGNRLTVGLDDLKRSFLALMILRLKEISTCMNSYFFTSMFSLKKKKSQNNTPNFTHRCELKKLQSTKIKPSKVYKMSKMFSEQLIFIYLYAYYDAVLYSFSTEKNQACSHRLFLKLCFLCRKNWKASAK